jgi:hypothetical protein
MKSHKKLIVGVAAMALLCLGTVGAQAATYNLNNIASGNWNDQNARQSNNYQIGFSTERPHIQAAYFEYDLTPARGKHVTGANLLIAGSNDYNITTQWPGHPPGPNFKVGIAAMKISANSVSQIVTGNNIGGLYGNQTSSHTGGNPDGGYAWVPNGVHSGVRFDAFHYEGTGKSPPRIQNAVNAGGLFVFWSNDRFDTGAGNENYIWGSTGFHAGNQLQIITSN